MGEARTVMSSIRKMANESSSEAGTRNRDYETDSAPDVVACYRFEMSEHEPRTFMIIISAWGQGNDRMNAVHAFKPGCPGRILLSVPGGRLPLSLW